MNNTDNIDFFSLPLIQQLFIGFILICAAIVALIDLFIAEVIYQKFIGLRIDLHIAHFFCTILFIVLFIIMLVGIIIAAILNVVFNTFL